MDILNFACDVISVPLPENKENFLNNQLISENTEGDSDLEGTNQVTLSNIVTLPWVPGLSPKLRKVF